MSFGDVTGEYLALRRQAGLVTGQHEALRVHGSDAVSFLQGLITQDVDGVAVGSVSRSMLLTPRGKLRSLLWSLRGEQEVVLIADAGLGVAVAGDLGRFKIRVDVTIDDPVPVAEVWGPGAGEALQGAGVSVPDGWMRSGSATVARVPLGGLDRFMIFGDVPDLSAIRECGSDAATAVRVEAGEPLTGRDLDEKTLVHETGLDSVSVAYDKGCYLGQEVVARIEYRGHVNRLLRGIEMEENVIPPEGATVRLDGKQVGVLTSPSESLTLGAPIGLALVRVEVDPGTSVRIEWEGGGGGAAVRALPMDTFTQR